MLCAALKRLVETVPFGPGSTLLDGATATFDNYTRVYFLDKNLFLDWFNNANADSPIMMRVSLRIPHVLVNNVAKVLIAAKKNPKYAYVLAIIGYDGRFHVGIITVSLDGRRNVKLLPRLGRQIWSSSDSDRTPAVITPNGKYIYMLSASSASVYVYSTADEKFVKTISLPVGSSGSIPTGIAIAPEGGYVVVIETSHAKGASSGGYAYVIDTQTQAIVPAKSYHISKLDFVKVAITPTNTAVIEARDDPSHVSIIRMDVPTYTKAASNIHDVYTKYRHIDATAIASSYGGSYVFIKNYFASPITKVTFTGSYAYGIGAQTQALTMAAPWWSTDINSYMLRYYGAYYQKNQLEFYGVFGHPRYKNVKPGACFNCGLLFKPNCIPC